MLNAKQIRSTKHQAADRSWFSEATATKGIAYLAFLASLENQLVLAWRHGGLLSRNSKYEMLNAKQDQNTKHQATDRSWFSEATATKGIAYLAFLASLAFLANQLVLAWRHGGLQSRNSKYEMLNAKQDQNTKYQATDRSWFSEATATKGIAYLAFLASLASLANQLVLAWCHGGLIPKVEDREGSVEGEHGGIRRMEFGSEI